MNELILEKLGDAASSIKPDLGHEISTNFVLKSYGSNLDTQVLLKNTGYVYDLVNQGWRELIT